MNINMDMYYFLDECKLDEKSTDIIGFSHSLIPKNALQRIETIHIDLTKNEAELFQQLHRSNRKQINKAARKQFHIEVLNKPSAADIRAFQKFYNRFAKDKNTTYCNSFHVNTMNRLKDMNALVITKVLNELKEIMCYRVYITDGDMSFSLYSASHFRLKKKAEERRLLSEASRYLLWRNILYFKELNHTIYDMGGLTTNENIRSFKMEFGGKLTAVYSGYESNSFVGKLILWLRTRKIKKG